MSAGGEATEGREAGVDNYVPHGMRDTCLGAQSRGRDSSHHRSVSGHTHLETTLPCQYKGEGDDRGRQPCYNLSNCMYYRLREARGGAF